MDIRGVASVCGHCGSPAGVSISVDSPSGWVDDETATFRTIATCVSCGGTSYLEVTAPEVQVQGP